jgi:hypothetical protein
MTRILLVETAAPRRVRKRALDILAGRTYPDPQVTILCRHKPEALQLFNEIPDVRVISFVQNAGTQILEQLNRENFDVVQAFWTTENKYLAMKILACRIQSKDRWIDVGDGGNFRLTWRFVLRYCFFRLMHPHPFDYHEFVDGVLDSGHEGERILIIQSAPPQQMLRGLEVLRTLSIFRNPLYSMFCRKRPEIQNDFKAHPLIHRIWTHSETRAAWKHLKFFRRQHFDGVIVFFTGDPSYWKIKWFAFLLGARHKIIFNECYNCFRFTPGRWLLFVAHRLNESWLRAPSSHWNSRIYVLLLLSLKVIIFPVRFVWLLLTWLRLRGVAFLTKGKCDDCSL